MADNVAITAGSGTSIATDDVGGVQYQKVKIDVGGDGASLPLSTTNPIPVELPSATVTTLTPPAAITGFATAAKQLPDGHSVALSATDNAVLDNIDTNTDSGAVVGGGTEATAQRVTIANDSTGVVSIDDNGGAITVDGTVAVTNAGITTIAGAVAGTEMQVDVVSMPTTTVQATNLDVRDLTSASDSVAAVCTNAGTFAVQADTELTTGDLDTGAGSDTRAVVGNVLASDGGGTLWRDDSGYGEDLTAGIASTATRLWDGSAYDRAPGDSTNGALVNLGTNNDVTVTNATAGNLNCTEASASAIKTAVEVIDNCISGSEAQVDVVAALPAGTNVIGAVKRDVINYTAVRKYYTYSGAVTDGIVWSPASGKKWVITDLIINTSAAAVVTLEEDLAGGDSPIMKFELAANGGVSTNFQTPLMGTEDDADLIITTSAGNIYVTVIGYEID